MRADKPGAIRASRGGLATGSEGGRPRPDKGTLRLPLVLTATTATRLSDLATTPVSEREAETHELIGIAAPRAYLDHERRLRDAPHKVTTPVAAASLAAC